VERERERGKGTGKIHSPLQPCTRSPEWNFLSWLVENEREEKERRKVAFQPVSIKHLWSK
jgi:hypothetical protein